MKGNVPLKLVVAAAICVFRVDGPVACGRPGIIFIVEQAETIPNRAHCTPGEIGADAESADTSLQRKTPALGKIEESPGPDKRVKGS